ncbi:MmcQ/YjbR family DNA-binding protein [Rhodopirellula sp. JC740]|uniref:MmcQ/YjbR family DNA-binding protein n=1 Tax=Rhodopirellula halodulae TaxID=2894198 RepID=A0ABS8NBV8_9BACT|nr:MmcQ/YjbR family DNA-binding protein [Rhodopirellula sp. JC740]MCC9641046.1 MmcQ/YjbR family DNA-binding protein [Rhodopirellula sp. JC740]
MKSIRNAVIDYGMEKYGVAPDHPFEKYPSYFVLRHKDDEKWFALVMDVPKNRIGLEGEENVDILDVKCAPQEIGTLRKSAGFFPAYHMNKEHWLTVILDGTVPLGEIKRLIDQSFMLSD